MQIFTLLNTYKTHENELRTILDFITPDLCHDKVYSPQIAKHLLNSGSFFEATCKEIGRYYGGNLNSMSEYKDTLLHNFPRIIEFEAQISLNNRIIKPLDGWDIGKLSWWSDYNSVKHDYFKNINKGYLDSALKAFASYLITVLYLGYLENNKVCPDIPTSLAPTLIRPKNYKSNGFFNGGFFVGYSVLE